MKIEYTEFVKRQFNNNFSGTSIEEKYIDDIIKDLNAEYEKCTYASDVGDFCIYVSVPNKYNIYSPVADIKTIKKRWINTQYVSRVETELKVLTRTAEVPFWYKQSKSKYLVAVLYSKEQLLKEYNSAPKLYQFELSDDCEYGIVALLSSENFVPDPMTPITMMRNALGVKEGGNGVKLNRTLYNNSVDFWDNHILISKTKKWF